MGCKLSPFFLLSLLLIVSLIPLVYASIFSDGFESGDFGAWSTSGTCNIIETPVHHGTYSANVTGFFYKSGLTSTADAFGRCYVYLQELPPEGVNYVISKMYDSSWGSDYVGVIVTNDSGVMKFGLDLASGNYYNNTEVFVDTWYGIEYERDVTLGDARLWVDGVLWLEDTSETMGGDTVTIMGTSGDSDTWAVISDCYVFDSSYIGVEEEGQDLTFSLFENFKVWDSLATSKEQAFTFFQPFNLWSSMSHSVETAYQDLYFTLFENVNVWSSLATTKEQAFSFFENFNTWESQAFNKEIGFKLYELFNLWSYLATSKEQGFTFFQPFKLWSSLTMASEGVALDLYFTLFENVNPFASLVTVLEEELTLDDVYGLAALGFIMAIVAMCLAVAFKKK